MRRRCHESRPPHIPFGPKAAGPRTSHAVSGVPYPRGLRACPSAYCRLAASSSAAPLRPAIENVSGGDRLEARSPGAAGPDVVEELACARVGPSPGLDETVDQLRDGGEGRAGVLAVESAREEERVGGLPDTGLLGRPELRRPNVVQGGQDAPVRVRSIACHAEER